jgi:hypothetical protein
LIHRKIGQTELYYEKGLNRPHGLLDRSRIARLNYESALMTSDVAVMADRGRRIKSPKARVPKAEASKTKIFISYSREDMAFADRLEAALKEHEFEPLIDRTKIYAFEDWWKRIQALIAQADTIIFVLSPDSVASPVCAREVAFAASLNKRFAPIVFRRVDGKQVPEALARLNFIFFNEETQFSESVNRLCDALATDIDWIRKHTEYGEAARHWASGGRPNGLLLRSPALEEAEHWIASRPHSAPVPTDETRAFISESRRGATRRRNILTGSLAAGLLVTLALAGFAYWQRGVAIEQRGVAIEQRNVAESRRIATLAELVTSERLRGNWDTALKLGVHVARLGLALDPKGAEISWPRTALAATVLQSDLRLMLSGHEGPVWSAAFSSDGTRIVTASSDRTARIWDAANGRAARRSQSSMGIRAPCGPPPSAPTARASSRRHGTRPRASGTPRTARRSRYCAGTRRP